MSIFTHTVDKLKTGKGIPLKYLTRHLSDKDIRQLVHKILSEFRKSLQSGKIDIKKLFKMIEEGKHLKFLIPKAIKKIKIPKKVIDLTSLNFLVDDISDLKKIKTSYKKLKEITLLEGHVIKILKPNTKIWRSAEGIFHQIDITPSMGRNLRKKTRGEDNIWDSLKGKERCHSIGPGFGFDSPIGLYFCSKHVNQDLQNKGIEEYIRRLSSELPDKEKISLVTRTIPRVGGSTLREITYKVMHVDADGKASDLFQYAIGLHDTKGKIFSEVLEASSDSKVLKEFNKKLNSKLISSDNQWLKALVAKLP